VWDFAPGSTGKKTGERGTFGNSPGRKKNLNQKGGGVRLSGLRLKVLIVKQKQSERGAAVLCPSEGGSPGQGWGGLTIHVYNKGKRGILQRIEPSSHFCENPQGSL